MSNTDLITTDRLVAAIREGMATEPLLAEKARPVADHLAAVIRRRLPAITPADTGELMVHLAAAISVAMTVLSERGESPNSAILVATSAVAMAGVELHETEGTQTAAADLTLDEAQIVAWLERQRIEAKRLCNVPGLCETCRRSLNVIAHLRALLAENAQSKTALTQLQSERDRYRIAWQRARQRARVSGWAADKYAKRSHDLHQAAMDMLTENLGMKMFGPDVTTGAELAKQLQTFLGAFGEDPDDTVIENVGDRRLTVGMLRAAATGLEQGGDVRAVARVLQVYGEMPGEPLAMTDLRARFAGRIAALDARDTAAVGATPVEHELPPRDPCAVCYCRGCPQCVNPTPTSEVCFCMKAMRSETPEQQGGGTTCAFEGCVHPDHQRKRGGSNS